nr:MAG TPA: hypothetical protein [Caudoviricetes sp.]
MKKHKLLISSAIHGLKISCHRLVIVMKKQLKKH